MDKRHEENSTVKEEQMANKYMKRYSMSLTIREMHIETIVRYHYTPIIMSETINSNKTKRWQGC